MSSPVASRTRARRLRVLVLLGLALTGTVGGCSACESTRETFESTDAGGEGDAMAPPPPPFVDGAGDGSACARARRGFDPLGCEYAAFGLGMYGSSELIGQCTALFVSNPGDGPAHLRLMWKGKPVDLATSARRVTGRGRDLGYATLDNDELPAGASAVIALIQGVIPNAGTQDEVGRCPIPAAVTDTAAAPGLRASGDAFRLFSDEPVFAASFNPYTSDYQSDISMATGLRAAESWSSEYIDIGTYRPGRPELGRSISAPSVTAVVGREATSVSLASDSGLDTVSLLAGRFALQVQDDRFIGTKVSGDRPFGLFTGSVALLVPYDVRGANQVLHAIAAPSAWGWEYAAVKYPDRHTDRADPAVWRFVARSDNTVLSYEPAAPIDAPLIMNAGELAVFHASAPFMVRSQDDKHAFHVSQLMPSDFSICRAFDDAGVDIIPNECRGKATILTTPPASEFAQQFAFLTNAYYPDTSLVVVRRSDDNGVFRDVELDCAGTLGNWRPVGDGSRYEYSYVTITKDTFEPQTYPGGSCDNGAHTMKSAGLFTVAVWGWTHMGAVRVDLARFIEETYAFTVLGRRSQPDGGVAR